MGKRQRAVEDLVAVLPDLNFYADKRVLVTGHTGFKGAWLLRILKLAGADVCGYALEPPTSPSLFELSDGASDIRHVVGDIRDFEHLYEVVDSFRPEVVIHMAAQPIVLDGYKDPRGTYETNVMGTINLLEAVRRVGGVRSLVNVTTDKVYRNEEIAGRAYSEDDYLDGFDPYSNSKSCSDLATGAYARSFLTADGCTVSTVRAGNVIGGGDFASSRIIPDCVRAAESGEPLVIRNPKSTRPFQHVLEPLFAYLTIAQRQWEEPSLAGAYNIGPEDDDCITAGELVGLFAAELPLQVAYQPDGSAPHEAAFLQLDSSKLKQAFGWQPRWNIEDAIVATTDWTRAWLSGEDVRPIMDAQIQAYLEHK